MPSKDKTLVRLHKKHPPGVKRGRTGVGLVAGGGVTAIATALSIISMAWFIGVLLICLGAAVKASGVRANKQYHEQQATKRRAEQLTTATTWRYTLLRVEEPSIEKWLDLWFKGRVVDDPAESVEYIGAKLHFTTPEFPDGTVVTHIVPTGCILESQDDPLGNPETPEISFPKATLNRQGQINRYGTEVLIYGGTGFYPPVPATPENPERVGPEWQHLLDEAHRYLQQ